MEILYRKVKTKREILKQAMSNPYCGGTRFEFLDDDERPLIYNAMEKYALQQIQKLEAEKKELLEALENSNLQIKYLQEKFKETGSGNSILSKNKSLIKKMKP